MKYLITFAILFFCTGSISAQKQNEYVKVNQDLVNEIVKDIIGKQGAIDPVQKGWAQNLLTNAFQNYFANKNSKAIVYEQSDIKYFKDSINSLIDTIKVHKKAISSLKKQLSKENIDTRILEGRQEIKDSLNHILSLREKEAISLSNTIDSLNLVVIKLQKENTDLSSKVSDLNSIVAIAQNVTKQYSAKQKELESLYMEYINSQTLDYIDCNKIKKAISEYTDYVKIINVPIQNETKQMIEYLESVSLVSGIYANAKILLDSKYDEKAVSKWIQDAKQQQIHVAKLNDGQKTVFAQINNAMTTIGSAVNHFRNSVLKYLEEQGQIPDAETTQAIKDMLLLKLKNYGNGKYQDVTKYDPYQKHLNNILQKVKNGLNVMNEASYNSFILGIEKEL